MNANIKRNPTAARAQGATADMYSDERENELEMQDYFDYCN